MPNIKKKDPISDRMFSYKQTEYDMKCVSFCMNEKSIYISVMPIRYEPGFFYIDIVIRGKLNRSPQKYPVDVVISKIFEYYRYYYEKYAQKDEEV